MKKPYSKFFWSDWRNEMTLRLCSMAARGLWVEMLAIMGISERYGYLQIGGKVITEQQLAVMAGCSLDECVALVAELETNGVFSRDEAGIAYCRRMAREHIEYEEARKHGLKGGNPYLKRTQNPEARIQKLEATNNLRDRDNPTLKGDTNTHSDSNTELNPTLQACLDACEGIGVTQDEATAFYYYHDGKGDWHIIKNLKSALKSWQLKSREFRESRAAAPGYRPRPKLVSKITE